MECQNVVDYPGLHGNVGGASLTLLPESALGGNNDLGDSVN